MKFSTDGFVELVDRNVQVLRAIESGLSHRECQVYTHENPAARLLMYCCEAKELLEVPEHPFELPSTSCDSPGRNGLHIEISREQVLCFAADLKGDDDDLPVCACIDGVSVPLYGGLT